MVTGVNFDLFFDSTRATLPKHNPMRIIESNSIRNYQMPSPRHAYLKQRKGGHGDKVTVFKIRKFRKRGREGRRDYQSNMGTIRGYCRNTAPGSGIVLITPNKGIADKSKHIRGCTTRSVPSISRSPLCSRVPRFNSRWRQR